MPLYEYRCDNCGRTFELIQKFSDPPPEHCPNCGKGPIHKLMSSPAIQFKGTGWYVTDYARKDSVTATKAESNTLEKKEGGKKAEGGGEKSATSSSDSKKD